MVKEKFVPQDYVAACGPNTQFVRYFFQCDANTDSPREYYDVYLESNGRAGLQIVLGGGLIGDTKLNGTGIISLSHYHPCMQTHVVDVPKGQSIDQFFPRGYIVHPNATDFTSRDAREVRIWTANNTNIHCTRQLTTEDFEIKNPS